MDYSSDGVDEREIFPGGLANPGKGVQLEEVGDFQAGKGTGGPCESSGGIGMDGIYYDMPRNPSTVQPTASFGLEGLEAELAFFRSSEGLGVGHTVFAGLFGRPPPQIGQASSLLGPAFNPLSKK